MLTGVAGAYSWFIGGVIADVGLLTSTAAITLNTDGTISQIGSVPAALGWWFVPQTAGVGNTHWVRATVISGALTTGMTGVWEQLSIARTWSKTNLLITTAVAVIKLEIAKDALGAQIVGTCFVTLSATVIL